MKDIFNNFENRNDWENITIYAFCPSSLSLIWKKSPNGIWVRMGNYTSFNVVVEFLGAAGTIAAIEVPNPLLRLYVNSNKAFLEKLLDFLAEQQKDVVHIVPEQFVEQIKDLALKYSTQETLDAVNAYVTANDWKLKCKTKQGQEKADVSAGLEDGWICSDFCGVIFFKRIGDEIMAIYPSYSECISFQFRKKCYHVKLTSKSRNTLLTNYSSIIALLKHCSQLAEKETVGLQDYKESLRDVIKDYDSDETFECRTKEDEFYKISYKISNDIFYNPDTDSIRPEHRGDGFCMVLSDKEKEKILKTVHDFDAYIDNAHKKYVCASYGNGNKIYYTQYKDTIYYDYVVEYLDKPDYLNNQGIHITKISDEPTLCFANDESVLNHFFASTFDTYPIYMSAKENNDRLLELMMKDLAGFLLTDEEEKEVEKLSSGLYLRRLGYEHNKIYVIDGKSMNLRKFWQFLKESGYKVARWPYRESPRERSHNPMVNPHTKMGGETSPKDCEVISLNDFFKLFDIPEENS